VPSDGIVPYLLPVQSVADHSVPTDLSDDPPHNSTPIDLRNEEVINAIEEFPESILDDEAIEDNNIIEEESESEPEDSESIESEEEEDLKPPPRQLRRIGNRLMKMESESESRTSRQQRELIDQVEQDRIEADKLKEQVERERLEYLNLRKQVESERIELLRQLELERLEARKLHEQLEQERIDTQIKRINLAGPTNPNASIFEQSSEYQSNTSTTSTSSPIVDSVHQHIKKRGRPSALSDMLLQLGNARESEAELLAEKKKIEQIGKAYAQRMKIQTILERKDAVWKATRCPYWANMGSKNRQCIYERSPIGPHGHCKELHQKKWNDSHPTYQSLDYHPLDALLIDYDGQ